MLSNLKCATIGEAIIVSVNKITMTIHSNLNLLPVNSIAENGEVYVDWQKPNGEIYDRKDFIDLLECFLGHEWEINNPTMSIDKLVYLAGDTHSILISADNSSTMIAPASMSKQEMFEFLKANFLSDFSRQLVKQKHNIDI